MTLVITNPENEKYLKSIPSTLRDIKVQYIPCLPPRSIVKKWKPPESGRFTMYGPEDRKWLEPFGIGCYEVDEGPLFYFMENPLADFTTAMNYSHYL